MENKSGVYLITCNKNGNKYVGSAVNFRKRFVEHKYDLLNGNHHNPHLQNSWNKYGGDCFVFSILEIVSEKSKLVEREQHWIDVLLPEYNISKSAVSTRLGVKESKATLEKKSISKKRHWESLTDEQRIEFRNKIKAGVVSWRDGLSEEERKSHVEKISNPHTEKTKEILRQKTLQAYASGKLSRNRGPRSDETKKKLSEAATLQFAEQKLETARKRAEWELGREAREMERRRKLSEANSGKKLSKAQKEKLREIAKAQWSDPEYIAKHKAAVTEAMQDPERKRKMREAKIGKELTKEHKKKIGAAGKGKKRSAETRRRLSEARKLWWAKRKAQGGA